MRHRGTLGNYMDKYGVGWLLDTDDKDIDEEDSLPLLQELDINLSEIKYKIKCVIMPIANENLNRNVLRDNPGNICNIKIITRHQKIIYFDYFKIFGVHCLLFFSFLFCLYMAS